MVRHYHGTIEGIFWSFQESYDPSNFKPVGFIVPTPYYVYYGCNCIVNDIAEKYCINCNNNNLDDNDKEYIKDNLSFECNSIKYLFDSDDIEFINNKLFELELELGEYIINNINFEISEKEYIINDEFIDTFDKNIKKLIARYCLGKQILNAINNYNECIVICDL